ncbi:MAG TPA: GTP-binding protein [Stenomitos sp.]
MSDVDTRVPVTLVTGFLGAGKTTFLNHLLSSDHGARLAVIINEYDEVGIDRDLVVNTQGQLVEMNNGCLCCTVQGDMKQVIADILASGKVIEGLVIETTGLANPGPIATAFFADPYLCEATRLDAIVTLVDGYHLRARLETAPEEDRDLMRAQIGYADVLLLNKTDLLSEAEAALVETELRTLNQTARIHRTVQGVVPLEAVQHLEAFEFAGRFNLEVEDHHHAPDIGSISFRFEQAFDQVKLNTFFCNLLRDFGESIYRCKGVVNVQQLDEPLLFQGVSSLFATSSGRAWASDERRETRAVFIGRNLDRAKIERGLLECVAEPLKA